MASFILITLVYSAELITDVSYMNFTVTVSYRFIGQTPCSLEHYLVLTKKKRRTPTRTLIKCWNFCSQS